MSKSCKNIFAEEGYQHFNLSCTDKRRRRGAPFSQHKMEEKQSLLCLGEHCTCVNFTADILSWNLISPPRFPLPPSLSLMLKNVRHAGHLSCHWQISFFNCEKGIGLPHLGYRQQACSVVHLHLETISWTLYRLHTCLTDSADQFPEHGSGSGWTSNDLSKAYGKSGREETLNFLWGEI